MLEVMTDAGATEIDVDGLVDEGAGIRYLGKVTKMFDGSWRCLADVCGALCLVEVRISPTIHLHHDPGDEDDRTSKEESLARDLGPAYRRSR